MIFFGMVGARLCNGIWVFSRVGFRGDLIEFESLMDGACRGKHPDKHASEDPRGFGEKVLVYLITNEKTESDRDSDFNAQTG